MRICLDMRTGAGCGTENLNHAHHCGACGKPLRFALTLHDPKTQVGRYQIVRVIGYGAYGAVYEAIEGEQRQTSPLTRFFSRYTRNDGARCLLSNAEPDDSVQRVALKETFDASSISSFAREFKVLSGLQHPNLPRYTRNGGARCIDMFEAQGNGYLVMEYVPGQSLQEILDEQRQLLPESQVKGYALQLCNVLEYLHSQQPAILHRDIKPANIRLTPEGRIKLVDTRNGGARCFGLLKQSGYQTRATIRGLGTPQYAPIEQYGDENQITDLRSDLYSLGATLYHLLAHQAPLPAPNRIATTPDPLAHIQQRRPNLTPCFADAIMKALSLRPNERYDKVLDFKQAIQGRLIPSSTLDSWSEIEMQPVSEQPLNTEEQAEQAEPLLAAPSSKITAKLPLGDEHTAVMHKHLKPYLVLGTPGELIYLGVDTTGKTIVAITDQRTIYQWRAIDGKLLAVQTLPGQGWPTAVAMSADTLKIAVASRGVVQVWQWEEMKLLFEFRTDQGDFQHLAFRPDGEVLAGSVRSKLWLWQMSDGQLFKLQRFPRALLSLAYSPDGKRLACKTSLTFYLLDGANGKPIDRIKPKPSMITWHPDGQMWAGYGDDCQNNIYLWREGEEFVSQLKVDKLYLRFLKWIPAGQSSLIVGGGWSELYLWTTTEPYLQYICKTGYPYISYLDYALNGQVLVSWKARGRVVDLWELPELRFLEDSQEKRIIEEAIYEQQ